MLRLCISDRLLLVVAGLCFISAGQRCQALRLIKVEVPSEVVVDQSATLRCRYDLEGDTLYSVKWYKNGKEFFRFVLKDTPPSQIFPLEGIRVNLTASDDKQVTLQDINLLSAGRYRCEVSAEAPSFQTKYDTSEMSVIVLPREPPKITGAKATYQVGEELTANCTSLRSKPAANLIWTVTGGQVNQINQEASIRYPTIVDGDGMETSVLGIRFLVKEQHFRNGKMHLTCTASISKIKHDTSTSQNISNADFTDYPKQRSLESRFVAPSSGTSTRHGDHMKRKTVCLVLSQVLLIVFAGPLLLGRAFG